MLGLGKDPISTRTQWSVEIWRQTARWISLVALKCGPSLMWDVTCPDTCASAHLALAGVRLAVWLVTRGQNVKELDSCVSFCASGHKDNRFRPWDQPFFFTDLGKRVADQFRNPRHTPFCFSLWLSKFSGVMRQPYWELCHGILAFLTVLCLFSLLIVLLKKTD